MKNRIKCFGGSLAGMLLVASASLTALSTESELSFSGGWRQDHLRSYTTTSVDASTDLVKGSHLNIWQVGVQGWASPCASECDPWLNSFFARGSAYWGWVNDGIYLHETSPGTDVTFTFDRGDISHGHTWDYSVGGGYLFGCSSGFKIGPTGGYSSNKLTFKAENVLGSIVTVDTSSAIDPLAYFDEGVVFSSRWQGPWVGVDAFWDSCGWNIYASYEYHWTNWKGSFHSPSTDLDDDLHFSDRRTGKNGWGQTGYLGAHYSFNDCMIAGLGLKYQYFRAKGHLTPTADGGFPAVGGPEDEVDPVKTNWISFSITLDLGYSF